MRHEETPLHETTIRITLDVKISLQDIEATEGFAGAERALLHALLKNPEELQRILTQKALQEVGFTEHEQLETVFYGHVIDEAELYSNVATGLAAEHKNWFFYDGEWNFSNDLALYSSFDCRVTSINAHELNKEGDAN